MDVLEGQKSVCILLCGTSGTGKSTLGSLLGQALGITTIVSTDSVRHMLRGFTDKERDPVLWASTYEAGAVLQCNAENLTEQARVIKGYKQQSETVIKCVEKLIKSHAKRRQSLIVEGVHLSLGYVMRLMAQNPQIIPFLICIQNEAKHKEHFAVRAKYMTMEPSQNKYVRNFKNIRLIQDYLCRKADKYLIPKVNNTNVDRSIAVIHSTVVRCLRRISDGDQLLENNVAQVVNSEFEQIKSQMWSGKDMLSAIKESKEQSSKKAPIPSNIAVTYITEEHMSERSSSDVLLLEGPSSDLEFEQLRGTGDLEGIDQLGDEEEGSIVDPTTDHYTEEEEDAGSPTKFHPHFRKPIRDAKTFASFPEH